MGAQVGWGGCGDEQELCAYCMLFLFVLSLSVYILAEHSCYMYPGHSKVGGLFRWRNHRVHIFTRDETGSVYLPTQLERTLQLYW